MPNYQAWEERPLHPVTGQPADYFWERWDRKLNRYVREPRWRRDLTKRPDPRTTWFTVAEIAALCGVTPATVRNYVHHHGLPASRGSGRNGTGPGTRYRILGRDFIRWQRGQSRLVALPAKLAG